MRSGCVKSTRLKSRSVLADATPLTALWRGQCLASADCLIGPRSRGGRLTKVVPMAMAA